MEPLQVKPDGVIVSGHRRYKAALHLGLETVSVRLIEYADELEEREAIIAFNKQRVKTLSQKLREAKAIEEIEQEHAHERMVAEKRADPKAKLPEGSKGQAREKVAEPIGMKPRTYEKAKKVFESAESGDVAACDLLKKLDRAEIGIDRAYKRVTEKVSEEQHPQQETVSTEEDESKARIVDLFLSCYSERQVAAEVGVSRSSVNRVLKEYKAMASRGEACGYGRWRVCGNPCPEPGRRKRQWL